MTSLISSGQMIKTDVKGRLRTPRARQEELLDEFERSGLSGKRFAQVARIKYQTFAVWVARRRKARQSGATQISNGKVDPVRWIEATVERAGRQGPPLSSPLVVLLPGGTALQVSDSSQAALAVHIIKLLDQSPARTC
jgi:hypothetical protein